MKCTCTFFHILCIVFNYNPFLVLVLVLDYCDLYLDKSLNILILQHVRFSNIHFVELDLSSSVLQLLFLTETHVIELSFTKSLYVAHYVVCLYPCVSNFPPWGLRFLVNLLFVYLSPNYNGYPKFFDYVRSSNIERALSLFSFL